MSFQPSQLASLALLVCAAAATACGSSAASGTGGAGGSASTSAAAGDDCAADADCASGLCDPNNYCAAPVATTDGKACTTDATCPMGDQCHVATGKCFSTSQDGKGGSNTCQTNADCKADETCGADHKCAG